MRKLFKNQSFQAIFASLLCIVIGILAGFVALLAINPTGAVKGIVDILKNFMTFSRPQSQIKYLGNTLAKTAPLIMCSLSVLFCYKVGLFNIGAAGQYVLGAGASIYFALAFHMPWYVCILAAMVVGAVSGAIIGVFKSYFYVNEVMSGIMLNWISLYTTNTILANVKETASPYTRVIQRENASAIIPTLGLDKLFSDNSNVTIALPLTIIIAVIVWFILEKTKLGFELKATGYNKHAAKYCGMAEKRNTIVTLAVGGSLAALGAAMWYLTGYEQWQCSISSIPGMGFNGIASAFLGGLNPIGAIFSSYFIQHITEGGAFVDKTMYCAQVSDLISSIIIYACGFVFFIKHMINTRIRKAEDREAEIAKVNAETNPVAIEETVVEVESPVAVESDSVENEDVSNEEIKIEDTPTEIVEETVNEDTTAEKEDLQ
ncbi:MAG: ABC transporter permease [Clostridia bacterium]|nr:ABC transporter permease [Clostridia bacterium]